MPVHPEGNLGQLRGYWNWCLEIDMLEMQTWLNKFLTKEDEKWLRVLSQNGLSQNGLRPKIGLSATRLPTRHRQGHARLGHAQMHPRPSKTPTRHRQSENKVPTRLKKHRQGTDKPQEDFQRSLVDKATDKPSTSDTDKATDKAKPTRHRQAGLVSDKAFFFC